MARSYYIFFTLFFLFTSSCKEEKKTFKRIETKNYFLEGYTYFNYTNKIFPNELVLIDNNNNDTIYHCLNCYNDFHMILEDTLLIYGGNKLDSVIDKRIILKKIPVPQEYKYNLPFK
jgi:Sec7-like guanine-nucleotide exchange factor